MPATKRTSGPTDGKLTQVPWTVDLALRAARVDADMPKPDQEALLRDAVDAGLLGPEAVRALKRGGYKL